MESYDGVAQDGGAHQSGWHSRWTARITERLAARIHITEGTMVQAMDSARDMVTVTGTDTDMDDPPTVTITITKRSELLGI